jgi:hypothetical protein
MTRAQAWNVHAAAILVGGTGLAYGWMRYFAEPADELALVNHPLQPAFQTLHLLFAPLLVFACALVWSDHVWERVRNGHPARRRTGLALFGLFLPMVLSGAWVQVAEGELARALAIGTHAGSGTLWCLGYAVHLLSQVRRGNTGPSAESTAASSRSA